MTKTTRRTFLKTAAAATGTVSLPMAAFAQTESTWAKIKRTGVIKFANGSNYPPMEFMQAGTNVGYNVDMGEEIAKRLGLKAEWLIVEYKGIIGTLKSGRADVINSSTVITAERQKEVTFTRTYMDFGIGALYQADKPVKTPAEAKGKVIGCEVGTAGERWARDNVKDAKEIKAYEQLILAIKDLAFGRIDLVVNNVPVLAYNMSRIGAGGKPLGITDVWDTRATALAVRHEDTELLGQLNGVLEALEKEGWHDAQRKKWFGA